jgi:hypothetical protein
MLTNEILPGGRPASRRNGRHAVPAQDVAHGLVGNCVPQICQGSHNPIVTPARVFWTNRTTRFSISAPTRGRPGDRRCFEPSNLAATSWRYQLGMVSGLARRATCCRAFRPKRLPISASVNGSPSESRKFRGECAFKIRSSAARCSILQEEFLIDQSGNVGPEPRPCGFVCH